MSKLDGIHLRVVLHENTNTNTDPSAADARFETLSALLDGGFDVTSSAADDAVAPRDGEALAVLGRFNGTPPADVADLAGREDVSLLDTAGLPAADIVARVHEARDQAGARKAGEWKPWFPVIDYDRCTNCMQCLSFCLFDVYGVSGSEKIQVQHEDHCKTDCPACSRVCPEVAILFPKYKSGPINGDVVRKEDMEREAMKVDVSALLGGDIYASLRTRNEQARKRFSTERDESRALLERKRCLKKLKADLDIPDEVLMTLPSVGDIEQRAERARAKVTARRARSQTIRDQSPAPSADEWGI